jgi:hypothetical protein
MGGGGEGRQHQAGVSPTLKASGGAGSWPREGVEIDDPREEIARLEAVIEEAAEAAERCRKFILAGKLSTALGVVWMLAAAAGPLAGLASLAGATAALLGGIVVFGSNTMTARQIAARIQAAEDARTQLIDRIALRPIAD